MIKQDKCKKCGSTKLIVEEREVVGPNTTKLIIICKNCNHKFCRYM